MAEKKSFAKQGKAILEKKELSRVESMDDFLSDGDTVDSVSEVNTESRKPVKTESRKSVKTESRNDVIAETEKPIKKTIYLEDELNELLRTCSFRNKVTERSIVEEALRLYFKKHKVEL